MDLGLFTDIFVGLVVLVSVGIAFMRGFIREVLTIFGIVGGIVAAYVGGPLLAPYMRGWLGVEEGAENTEKLLGMLPYSMLADVLAYGVILIIFVILLSIISHFIAEFAKNLGLGALDRTLGVVFGIVRAVLVLGFLYTPIHFGASDEQKEEWFESSKTQIYLSATTQWMSAYFPQGAEDKIEEGIDQVSEASEMRKKVQELGILGETEQKALEQDVEKVKEFINNKEGYSEEFRDNMDELFEDKIDNTSGALNE